MSMQPPPEDESLERELAALYRHLPKAEPDAALDARILAQARGSAVRQPRRYRRLLVGLGGISALAMAAGLTWHMYAGRLGMPSSATAPPVSNHRHAPAAASTSDVVRVRILADKSAQATEGHRQRRASAAQPFQGTPSPPPVMARRTTTAKPPAQDERVVVPVHVLPAAAPSRRAGLPPPGGIKATVPASASPPSRTLIAQARQALLQHDETLARRRVLEFVRAYPHKPLPDDLSRLRPAAIDKGSP